MNFKEKSRQWENRQLNKYLDSLDREDEDPEDDVYNDNYDEIIENGGRDEPIN